MPLEQSLLKQQSFYFSDSLDQKRFNESYQRKKTAFLCHSHKDTDLVKGLIVFFRNRGISLYIDWQDYSMPPVPNAETAKRIQDKIIGTNLFLFLATNNSMSSRWCPWEIGYADACDKRVIIIPTTDNMADYGSEYLQLYHSIGVSMGDYYRKTYNVFPPGIKRGPEISNDSIFGV